MIHPNDANGNALRRMEAEGDDLSRPRNIDFTVIFSNGTSAEEFARHFRWLGKEASVEVNQRDQEFGWDVVLVRYMVPSHAAIRNFESRLQTVGVMWGGRSRGGGVALNRLDVGSLGLGRSVAELHTDV